MTQLSKRDQFALAAMQGFCANPAIFASNPMSGWDLVNCTDEILIAKCFHFAELAIAESARTAPKEAAPDSDGWIEWRGGECPVPKGEIVDVRYRNGRERFGLPAMERCNGCDDDASDDYWHDDGQYNDIVAYRVVNP